MDKIQIKSGKTAVITSDKGVNYHIHAYSDGSLEAWVEKSVPAPGGNRIKSFPRELPKGIKSRIEVITE